MGKVAWRKIFFFFFFFSLVSLYVHRDIFFFFGSGSGMEGGE